MPADLALLWLLQLLTSTIWGNPNRGYASDPTSIGSHLRHQPLQVEITDAEATAEDVRQPDSDLVMHLVAESLMDRSIDGPGAFQERNVLPAERQAAFRFHHISTDEMFGSLEPSGRFSETTLYDPSSPYSAQARLRPPGECLA